MAKGKQELSGPSLVSYKASGIQNRWWPLIAVTLLYCGLFASFFNAFNQRYELKVLAANRVSTLNLKFRVFMERSGSLLLDSQYPDLEQLINRLLHDQTEITTRFNTARSTLESVLPRDKWQLLVEANETWKTFASEVFTGIDNGISGPSGRTRFIDNLGFRRGIYASKLSQVKDVLNMAETQMKSSLEGYRMNLTYWMIFLLVTYAVIVVMMQRHPLLAFMVQDDSLPGFLVPPGAAGSDPYLPAEKKLVLHPPVDSTDPVTKSGIDEVPQSSDNNSTAHENELKRLRHMVDILKTRLSEAPSRDEIVNSRKANSAFLANLSHEIRTPLSGIMGMVELLFETPINREQEEIVSLLKSSNRNLLQLINSMIRFSSNKEDAVDVPRIFKPGQVVEDAVILFSEQAFKKGIELEVSYGKSLPEKVTGVPHKIHQVLVNLVSNAIKFTDSGGVIVRVTSRPDPDKSQSDILSIQVEDSGVGIPEKAVKYLFEPITNPSDTGLVTREGSGLGLAISMVHARSLHGTISYSRSETAPNGSRFTLDVPVEKVSVSRHESTYPRFANFNTICVSQSKWMREVVSSHASLLKFSVLFVNSLGEAMAEIKMRFGKASAFKAVFIDEDMITTDSLNIFLTSLDERETWGAEGSTDNYFIGLVMMTRLASRKFDYATLDERSDTGIINRPLRISRLAHILGQIDQANPLLPDEIKFRKRVVPQSYLQVLAVEDTTISQELFSRQLSLMGLDFEIVADGESALKKLENRSFDIILLDCNLPGMDGFETARIIRKQPNYSDSYIIGITANADPEVRKSALASGMDEHLTKPLSLQKLEIAIYSRYPEFLF